MSEPVQSPKASVESTPQLPQATGAPASWETGAMAAKRPQPQRLRQRPQPQRPVPGW